MNQKTIDKLRKNPHYKMVDNQSDQKIKSPMTQFGDPEIHPTSFDLHPTGHEITAIKGKRKSKKKL